MQRMVFRAWFAVVVLATTACQANVSPEGRTTPAAPSEAQTPRGSKTLVIGSGFAHGAESQFSGIGEGNTDAELSDLITASLTRINALNLASDPWMAEEVPSLEKGTWIVQPDGTMVTTYRLRPNIKWHDGTPVTLEDWRLGLEMAKDQAMAHKDPAVARLITSVESPDERTLTFHWSRSFNRADSIVRQKLSPLPTHLIGETYRQGDVLAVQNLSYWVNQYVGTGPFRVVRWDMGQEMELAAFEDFYLGRPKLDRIVWRFIYDLNTMLTNVLSNNIDVATREAFNLDTGLTARQQWEAAGEGTISFSPVRAEHVILTPTNPWLADLRVRRALLHAIDRQEMADTLSFGLEQVAHIPLIPKRPQFERAVAAAAKYDYSPERARQLLAEAGWTPGADGILVNSRGERFVINGQAERLLVRIQTAVANYWRQVGVELQAENLTSALVSERRAQGQFPSAAWGNHGNTPELYGRFYSSATIPTAQNRWLGGNTAFWDDPVKEAVLSELETTLDRRRVDDLLVEFNRLHSEQLPELMLKYQAEVMSVRKHVVNLYPRFELGGEYTRTWNAEQWDLR